MRRFSRNIRTTKWTDIYETTLAPWLLPTVFTANIGKKKSIFRVTDKSAARENNSAFHYTLPYIAGIALSIIGIVRLVGLSGREQTFTYCVILFWLFLNLYFMVMALYIAAGRKIKTDYQIQNICAEAVFTLKTEWEAEEVQAESKRYTAECKGFSDNFIVVEFPSLKQGHSKDGNLFLKETEITLPLKRGILQNSDTGNQYVYEIDWENADTDTYYHYMDFLYNRMPVLPQELKRSSIFDECITALISRLTNE